MCLGILDRVHDMDRKQRSGRYQGAIEIYARLRELVAGTILRGTNSRSRSSRRSRQRRRYGHRESCGVSSDST